MISFEKILNTLNDSENKGEPFSSTLIESIKGLSHTFTKRDQIKTYAFDPLVMEAYSLFYFYSNQFKLHKLFSDISPDLKNKIFNCSFVDYGTGPGTFALTYLDLRLSAIAHDQSPQTEIKRTVFIDQSQEMLSMAKKFFTSLFSAPELTQIPHNFIQTRNTQDLKNQLETLNIETQDSCLFFGHSLNEMPLQSIEQLIIVLRPQFIIFIEPGTQECFRHILNIQAELFKLNYFCHYPCQEIQNKPMCPMKSLDQMWCHQIVRPHYEAGFHRLSQLCQIDRRSMAMIAHVYERIDQKIITHSHCTKFGITENQIISARFVQFIKETKHSLLYKICLVPQEHKILTLEIPLKSLTKIQRLKLQENSIGHQYQLKILKILPTETLRASFSDLAVISRRL